MKYSSMINFITFGIMFGLTNLSRFYFKRWDLFDLPISLPIFGIISRREELLSIRDNFLQGSLRDGKVEKRIKNAEKPIIVDCGVNVGVTVRWWFHLNPNSMVYGIDMMQEANDFTINALQDRYKKRFFPITAVLDASTGHAVELSFDNPLFGANNARAASGDAERRYVNSKTLDDCLRDHNIDAIDLLKVDVEDSAARMFQGAAQTLTKVKNIFLELHSDQERYNATRLLYENGFRIRRSYKRHLWLEKMEN